MIAGRRYVTMADIRAALSGRETELLDALDIPWSDGHPHIRCPYREHTDGHPSWRWDKRKRKAFCTCGARYLLGVVMGVEGIEFEAAKIRAAELLKRGDLFRERRNGAAPPGCRLADYAEAKRLPVDFLLENG